MGRKRRFFETDDDIENDDDFVPVDENLESNLTGWIKTEAEPRRSSRRKVSKTETKTEPLQSLSEVFDDENKPVRVASRGTSRQYSKKARTTMVRGTVFHLEFWLEKYVPGVKSCVTEEVVSLKFSGAPVDVECPLKASHKVAQTPEGQFYDVMLNQTNIAANNNKYYILQLLEKVTTGAPYAVWFRWGRVGHINGTMLKEYDTVDDLDDAIDDFSKKFFDKTKNDFCERADFVHVPGKYDYIQRDYGADIKEEPDQVKTEPCELEQKVQDLLNLICNVKMMEKCVKEMKFDISKAPLGKLSSKQIQRGFAILAKIEETIKNRGVKVTKLSSQYYTHIPHDFGFKKLPTIENMEMVEAEVELLKSLEEITVAVNLNQGDAGLHPLTKVYKNLKCDLKLASKSEFDFISRYIAQSHGETHTTYGLELETLYKVARHSELGLEKNHKNWHYLWHGSS